VQIYEQELSPTEGDQLEIIFHLRNHLRGSGRDEGAHIPATNLCPNQEIYLKNPGPNSVKELCPELAFRRF
jgi:hypothetical protein